MQLLGTILACLTGLASASGQAIATLCVHDDQGRPLPGAEISRSADPLSSDHVLVAADGCAGVGVAAAGYARGVLTARKEGYTPATVTEPQPGERVTVVLTAAGIPLNVKQAITVTADRGLVGVTDQATSVAVLDGAQMDAAPGLSLDDRLHQVAGFQLYRRTSSWTANPTTEGVSLRGLGSTAASRTLVESDEVPLNDPFGGWIHWDEIPQLAIADVVLERGGAADLYGSSAIGGVIEVEPVLAGGGGPLQVAADALGATENSAEADFLLSTAARWGDALLAGSGVTTGGYVPTAPAFRGAVDVPANVAEQSGRLELRRPFGTGARASGVDPTSRNQQLSGVQGSAFLRGDVLNEARANGTPVQSNGTRLWRYAGGTDVDNARSHAALRVFGDRETYRQSFSAIAADRNTETLTRLQRVPLNELGFSLTGSREFGAQFSAGAGLDLRDVRATDAETPVSRGATGATTAISAHQRGFGGFAEGVWQPRQWSVAGSIRVDSFRTFDGKQTTAGSAAVVPEPEVDELVASPHLGVVRQLRGGLALTADVFRAFRGPTMNELYRTGQVGQQTTLANPGLLAERATGFEFGGEFADFHVHGTEIGHLRASYFWTEVNRPISAVALSQTATSQTLQRQNLGQIRSRGLSLEAGTARWRGLDFGVGWQLAVATVTAFNTSSPVQTNLRGNWIPEVPRESVVATANWVRPAWANLHAIVSYTGRTYDDAANQYLLHPYARVDVSADRALWRGLSVYAGAQNAFDRLIEAGRTPVLTLAAPRLVQGGLRWSLTR